MVAVAEAESQGAATVVEAMVGRRTKGAANSNSNKHHSLPIPVARSLSRKNETEASTFLIVCVQ